MILLSAVVPIASNFRDFQSMKAWLQGCVEEDIEVLMIRDSFDETNIKLFEQSLSSEIDNKSILVFDGQFNSPGSARNLGIEKSNGEWLVFWDADDIPNPSNVMIELHRADKNLDAIVGQFSINDSPHLSKDILDLAFNPGNWRVVYRRSFIGNTRFKNYMWGEDQLFIIESRLSQGNNYFSKLDFYNYRTGASNQLTSVKSNSESLKSVLKEAYSLICDEKRDSARLLASLIMVIRMSATCVSKASPRKKVASIWFAIGMNRAFLSLFGLVWLQASLEVVKRKINRR